MYVRRLPRTPQKIILIRISDFRNFLKNCKIIQKD